MMVTANSGGQVVEHLVRLGIPRNEAKLYVALTGSRGAAVAELGEITGVPSSKIYAALRNLERKGFVVPLGGQIARFAPVESKIALHGWVESRAHEREFATDAEHHLVAELLEILPPVPPSNVNSAPAYIEAVSGKARIAAVSEELLRSATKSIDMVQQPPYFQGPSKWNKLEVKAVRRGADVRVIYSREAVADERRYRPLLSVGAALRVLDVAPMKLIVSDGTRALVALRDPLTGEQAVTSAVIHHPDLVAAIALLFQKEWERAGRLVSDLA
jgi:HTH-type transcriptional regulator, sugar sensing transcriptional regulator